MKQVDPSAHSIIFLGIALQLFEHSRDAVWDFLVWKSIIYSLRIHWRLSTISKTSSKIVWSNAFWYVKVYIFWNCIQYTIHWDKTQMLNIFPSVKRNYTKNALFFLSRAATHHSFALIYDSYMSWSTKFVSLKLCVEFSIFDFVSFSLKFIFLFNKV